MGAREAPLIIRRLPTRSDIVIAMNAENYVQALEICGRMILIQHGKVTSESGAAAPSAEKMLAIVRRECRAARMG